MAPSYPADPVTVIEQEISLMEQEAGDVLRVGAEIANEFVTEPVHSAKANVLAEPTLAVQLASQVVDHQPIAPQALTPLPTLMIPKAPADDFKSYSSALRDPTSQIVERAMETFKPAITNWLRLNHSNATMDEPASGATKLRRMLFETNELIVCPGVYDGLSARTALELGFKGLYMTGAGTTASRLGQPDLAIAQLHEMRENAEMIANLDPFGPPLIADMDTGYGGPIMAARTVEQYIRAGVAGAHLEDQVLLKRCGHLSGKKVVSQDEYISRIRAAHAARVRMRSDFVLIARTDALQQHGYAECIARLKRARDEGADVGLCEGFTSKEQAAQAVKDLAPWPLLLNAVENGKSPTITVDEARAMGFRIMIFSFATLAPAYLAIKETLMRLKTHGIVGTPKNVTPVTLFEVCGLKHSMAVDVNAGGASFKEGV